VGNWRGLAAGTLVANADEEIRNDGDIEEEHDDLDDGGMAINLEDLQRNQGAGDDRGKPFGPGFREPES